MRDAEHKRAKIQKWGFGMAPLSQTMRERYGKAVGSALRLVEDRVSLNMVDVKLISELKGMFNRCIKKNQWDWLTVYEQFGEPSRREMQYIVSKLSELRKAIVASDWEEANRIRLQLVKSNLRTYLLNFANTDSKTITDGILGWIYILSTRQDPSVLKIGMTTRSVAQRVKEINSATGVLYPYSARSIYKVKNARQAEREIFELLKEYRVRDDREFFQVPFVKAAKIVEEYIRKSRLLCRRQGTIKWFSKKKGYGFINSEDSEELFVHRLEILCAEDDLLKSGQIVEFEIAPKQKGLSAINVVILTN